MIIIDTDKIKKYIEKELKKYNNKSYNSIIKESKKIFKLTQKYYNLPDFYIINNFLEDIRREYNYIIPVQKHPKYYFLKNMKIDNPKYKILDTLGKGFYGEVYKIKYKNKIYALKEQNINKHHLAKTFLNEINFMKKVNKIRPRISPIYYKSWINNNKGYILTEYINCGTLDEYIKNNVLSVEDNKKIKNILKILHKNGIYHSDSHRGNFLVKCNKNNKAIKFYINDFGLSQDKNSLIKRNYEYYNYNNNFKDYLNDREIDDILYDIIIYKVIKNNIITLKEI